MPRVSQTFGDVTMGGAAGRDAVRLAVPAKAMSTAKPTIIAVVSSCKRISVFSKYATLSRKTEWCYRPV